MKYHDLKEMTITEWDGTPFKAYVTDNPDETIDPRDINDPVTIVSFDSTHAKHWKTAFYNHFMHVYPVEWNEATINKPKRMTHRQLAKWLAQGNGEATREYSSDTAFIASSYDKPDANSPVGAGIKVRTWDSEEWIEPTVDLLDKS